MEQLPYSTLVPGEVAQRRTQNLRIHNDCGPRLRTVSWRTYCHPTIVDKERQIAEVKVVGSKPIDFGLFCVLRVRVKAYTNEIKIDAIIYV